MAEEKSPVEKKSKKRIIIIAVAILALLLAGIGAYLFFSSEEKSELPPPKIQAPSLGPMVDLKDFVVNIITDNENHYVKTAITLELSNSSASEEVTQRMPQMRDSIILLFGNKDYRELQDLQGKKQLKAEITSRINSILQSGQVVSVYFTDFVVQ